MKFTFKKMKKEGCYSSFQKDQTDIKYKKKECGSIFEKDVNCYKIRLMIQKDENHDDGNINCSWMNIFFKNEFKTENEAREWLNKNIGSLFKKYKIYFCD